MQLHQHEAEIDLRVLLVDGRLHHAAAARRGLLSFSLRRRAFALHLPGAVLGNLLDLRGLTLALALSGKAGLVGARSELLLLLLLRRLGLRQDVRTGDRQGAKTEHSGHGRISQHGIDSHGKPPLDRAFGS